MRTARTINRFIETELLDGPPGGDPLEQGLLDSLAVEQLIGYIEDTYRFSFTEEELVPENFATVAVLATLVDRKRSS